MIVECPHCNQLLQTPETDPLHGKDLDVRCPVCSGGGILTGASQEAVSTSLGEQSNEKKKLSTHDSSKSGQTLPSDLSIPEDAFNHFRFPAETEALRSSVSRFGKLYQKLLFAVISLIVVIFFAVLVNIVLPGTRPYNAEHSGLPVNVNFNENSGIVNR